MKERIKSFWYDLRIFIPYLVRRFFQSFIYLFRSLQSRTEQLNRTYIWVKITAAMTFLFFVLGKDKAAAIMVVAFILAGIRHEWVDGKFRSDHTKKIMERARINAEIEKIKEREVE